MAAILRAYMDESVDKPETMFTVGGFIGPEQAWVDLEPKWKSAIPPELGCFHATTVFSSMAKDDAIALLDIVTNLIIESGVRLFGCGVDLATYTDLAPQLRVNEFGGNQYVAPFSYAVEIACKDYMSKDDIIPRANGDVCAFFIEDGDWKPGAAAAIRAMKESPEDRWWRNKIGTDTYGTSKDESRGDFIRLLQVGDYGAFLANKWLTDAPDKRIAWRPYYDKLRDAGSVFIVEPLRERGLKMFYAIFQYVKLLQEDGIDTWEDLKLTIGNLR